MLVVNQVICSFQEMKMKATKLVPFALAALALSAIGPVSAAPLTVSSYDMLNGNTGSYNYWDESYSGSGSKFVDGAPLSGGKGDLTDGIIAAANWFITEAPAGPGPYVGWTINPVIHFHFAGPVNINQITFSLDDANGAGGVSTPQSVVIGGTSHAIADPIGSAPFQFVVSNLNLNVSDLDIQFIRNNQWVFVSEVSFDGQAGDAPLPEPGILALLGLGMTGLALARRR